MIKNGANPNIPNKKNYKSPLAYASQSGKDNFVILLLKQNGIIIQPNAISMAANKEMQNLIRSKIKQLDYEYKIKKLKNDINFKESSYIIPLLDELRENK